MYTSPGEVVLLSRPSFNYAALEAYLYSLGASEAAVKRLFNSGLPPAETLIEAAGRLCYRSWEPGLNANVTKVREDSRKYIENIVASLHGSVLEHANFSFLFTDVSRVFTHELVRHRSGVSISQESLRYVRLTEIGLPQPQWALDDPVLQQKVINHVVAAEELQEWMGKHFGIDKDGVPFSEKKKYTSYMRRLAPDGVGTSIVWGANARALRHIIEMRTAHGAEEEMRVMFDKVAVIVREEMPNVMADFARTDDGAWVPQHRKV